MGKVALPRARQGQLRGGRVPPGHVRINTQRSLPQNKGWREASVWRTTPGCEQGREAARTMQHLAKGFVQWRLAAPAMAAD